MAFSAAIQNLDRLTVKSIMRGSTATIAGVIGTLAVFILCMVIYIPPANSVMKGSYFESQFYTGSIANQKFTSDKDFKIAVAFKNKVNNTPANHSAIKQYAYSIAVENIAGSSEYYTQPMQLCEDNPDYFKGIQGVQLPSSCFIFPEYAVFQLFMAYGYYTTLEYQLWAMTDPNPFTSAGNQLSTYQQKLEQLLLNYYYEVYFTSKIIRPDGSSQLVMNHFFSTTAQPTSFVGASVNQIIYEIRNTTMDISIMPWKNIKNVSNLVWMGQMYNAFLMDPTQAARYGVLITITQYMYQLRAFRYYKKVDFLMGVVGGAMLLFYLILWVPFNYINKTIHQIRNTKNLLLIKKGRQEQQVNIQNLHPAAVTWRYWVSNPLLNCFFPSLKRESDLINEGERQLDVVSLIKKLKVVERSLKKKEMLKQFDQKVLKMNEENTTNRQASLEAHSFAQSQNQSDIFENNVVIKETQFQEEEIDDKLGLTTEHANYVRTSQNAEKIFATSMTGLAIMQKENQISALKQLQDKNKWSAHHDSRKRPSKIKTIFNIVCDIIQKFDFFGARPNLNAGVYGSSFVGMCGVLLIILMTILTVYATLSNNNVPQIMILQKFEPEDNYGFTVTPGVDLKFAVCSNYLSLLQGNNRYALFRFFYQNKAGRTYFNPTPLTASDYSLFDLTKSTSPIDISYCFTMKAANPIYLGRGALDEGIFGFRMEPYCSSTPLYCQTNTAASYNNFITFMNNAVVILFLPENRFDPDTQKFINNLQFQTLNINSFYMNNASSMEETVYVDQVQIHDDTKNFFMRQSPIVTFKGVAVNPFTPYPLSRMFNSSSLYYEARILPSSQLISYRIVSAKADVILGIIGGVIVIWYAICHWIGKFYNNFQVRAAQADNLYNEDAIDENLFIKLLAASPIPLCLFPECFGIKDTITRIRQVDKKILNDLNYLWLVKYVDNIFNMSSTLFARPQEQNLSKVYIKEKIDESTDVYPQAESRMRMRVDEELDFQDLKQEKQGIKIKKKSNKIADQSQQSHGKINVIQDQKQMASPLRQQIEIPSSQNIEQFSQNYINGHPKPFKLSWMDTFEYQSSLTFKGKREVTSCCGGCCCLILLMFILIIVNFELGVYLSRSDTKIGMTTSIMQPLAANSNQTYNSNIILPTGSDFKLAVTFSTVSMDTPHNISTYISNGLSVSIFQKTYIKVNGTIVTQSIEYPMVPCKAGYLTKSLSSLVNPAYYVGEQLGYCAPDNLLLYISGIPEDTTRKSFTLSIFDRLNTAAGKLNLKTFLHNYYPKYHYTVPNKDYLTRTITYEIASIVFDPYNITAPIQQNLSLSKIIITYNDQIDFSEDSYTTSTYNVNAFQQKDVSYYGPPTQTLYYNLTFDNSFYVEHYRLQGVKFYQIFGIVGGLIAFFIFGFGCLAQSFNFYRMRYLIGRELYLFEVSKRKQVKNAVRGKVRKTKQQVRQLSNLNNLSQIYIFRAYLLSFVGGIWQNYNFDPILRRVTLIQQRVEKDLSLFEIYRKLHNYRDTLNTYYQDGTRTKPADIYLKHIYNPDPSQSSLDGLQKIKGYDRKHNWTAFEQFAIMEAFKAKINLREVFDSAFLERAFDLDESISHANLSNLNPTVMTSSINSEAVSHAQNED